MKQKKEKMVGIAMDGDKDALEWLVRSVQDRIYGLALKMLYQTPDAEDATQEILIKIVTRLESFRQESSFDTWALKIASNHLLNKRKSLFKRQFTFKQCEDMIIRDIPDQSTILYSKAEQELVTAEMRISCMQGLLQCLDGEHRVVYILGETMDVSGPEGSAILDIKPSTFRKRLSRARKRIRDFLIQNCELYDTGNPCKCQPQVMAAIKNGHIDPDHLEYAKHPVSKREKTEAVKQLRVLEGLSREAALMRTHPDFAAPEAFVLGIRRMLDSGALSKLSILH